MRMHLAAAAAALGVAALAGVAPAQATQLSSVTTTDTSANTLTVRNDRNVPVTVYMEYGDFDRRLGIVPASQTVTLALPPWAVRDREEIQLFVHPEGEADLASQEFSLKPPARLGMIVPSKGDMAATADGDGSMYTVIPSEEVADATLTVENPRSKAVTVFAENQGEPFDVRLGVVPAHSWATLLFPKSVVGSTQSIQIFVHPDAGEDLSSEALHIVAGQHLGLKVPLY